MEFQGSTRLDSCVRTRLVRRSIEARLPVGLVEVPDTLLVFLPGPLPVE